MAKNKQKTDLAWKATAAVATLAAGFVAERAVGVVWKVATGHEAPKDDEQLLDYRLAELAVFAVISGATMTLLRDLTLRSAAQWYGGKDLNPFTGERLSA